MIHRSLNDMVGGWMVGNFEPTCLKTSACEVACKHYEAGAAEAAHVHRIATELTLVASGRVTMNGRTFGPGDIILLEPGEATDFRALEKATTVVVKLPSVAGDKYLVDAGGAQ
jgi:quercetin dioxygenase-like cupin family protein